MSEPAKIRADQAVVQRGWTDTRTKAVALLMSGQVLEGDKPITKPATKVNPERLRLRETPQLYVGRGGDKLASFLESTPEISLTDLWCVDVGSSTGGFTDFCLRRGAEGVVCIDVGTAQLDYRLRIDPRVICLEQTDIREVTLAYLTEVRARSPRTDQGIGAVARERLGEPFDLAVVDVSFISLTKVLPAVTKLLRPDGNIIALVKPQFELGKGNVPKGGVVKDEPLIQQCVESVCAFAQTLGLNLKKSMYSGVKGRDGNQEVFVWLTRN